MWRVMMLVWVAAAAAAKKEEAAARVTKCEPEMDFAETYEQSCLDGSSQLCGSEKVQLKTYYGLFHPEVIEKAEATYHKFVTEQDQKVYEFYKLSKEVCGAETEKEDAEDLFCFNARLSYYDKEYVMKSKYCKALRKETMKQDPESRDMFRVMEWGKSKTEGQCFPENMKKSKTFSLLNVVPNPDVNSPLSKRLRNATRLWAGLRIQLNHGQQHEVDVYSTEESKPCQEEINRTREHQAKMTKEAEETLELLYQVVVPALFLGALVPLPLAVVAFVAGFLLQERLREVNTEVRDLPNFLFGQSRCPLDRLQRRLNSWGRRHRALPRGVLSKYIHTAETQLDRFPLISPGDFAFFNFWEWPNGLQLPPPMERWRSVDLTIWLSAANLYKAELYRWCAAADDPQYRTLCEDEFEFQEDDQPTLRTNPIPLSIQNGPKTDNLASS